MTESNDTPVEAKKKRPKRHKRGGKARNAPKNESNKRDKKGSTKRSTPTTKHNNEASNEDRAQKRARKGTTEIPPVRLPTDADEKAASKIDFTKATSKAVHEKLKFGHLVDMAECSIHMGILLLLCGWMPGALDVKQGTVEFFPCGPRVNRNVSQGHLVAEILQTFVGNPAGLPERTDNPRFDDDKPVLILSSMVSFVNLFVATRIFLFVYNFGPKRYIYVFVPCLGWLI